MMSRKTFNQH